MTTSPWWARLVRIGVAGLDYGLMVLLAGLGSMVWVAAALAVNPDPAHLLAGFASLVVGWMFLTVFLFWRLPLRRVWRLLISLGVLVAGIAGWFGLCAFLHEMDIAGEDAGGRMLPILQFGAVLVCLMGLFVLRREALKRGWLTPVRRLAVAVVVAGALVYLGWDEPVAPSVARNHAAMAGRSDDVSSYRLTLRYTPGAEGAKMFTAPSRKLEFGQKGEKLTGYLQAHRVELAANWEELAEVRAWWAEMVALPVLGDRVAADGDQPFIRFAPVRAYAQHATAIASLKALDGDGDGALAMAGDVYAVGLRLESASCSLVRGMIAVVVQKQALDAAEFVLDHASVSDGAKARFSGLLAERKNVGAGAKRLVLMDVANFFGTAESVSRLKGVSVGRPDERWPVRCLQSASALVCSVTLNPQATSNRMHETYEKLSDLAQARDLAGMKGMNASLMTDQLGGFQVKNLSGRLLLRMTIPGFENITQSYWQAEDKRIALLKRLAEPAHAP